MFKDISGKGFQLTFDNGNTISVQFGACNYCEHNYEHPDMKPVNLLSYTKESKDAEIAVWDKNGNWITNQFVDCDGDDVKGFLSANEVEKVIHAVAIAD